MGVIAAFSTFDPHFALRLGAIVALLITVPIATGYRPVAADFWSVGFAALSLASMFWTVSPDLTAAVAKDQIAVAVLFIVFRVTLRTRRALGIVSVGYLAGCMTAILLVIQENVTAQVTLEFHETATRYALEGLNPNYIAYALSGGIAVSLLLYQVWSRSLPFVLAVLVALYAGTLLTGSRGGIIAFVATAAWLLVPPRHRSRGLSIICIGVAVFAAAIVLGSADELIHSYVDANRGRETGDLNGRLEVWPIAREAFHTKLWTGYGAGTFPELNPRGVFAHNALLDVGTGLGLVGLAAFGLMLWTALASSTRAANPRGRAFLLGALACVLAPPLLTGYWHQSPAAWITIALFSRIAVVLPPRRSSSDPNRSPAPCVSG